MSVSQCFTFLFLSLLLAYSTEADSKIVTLSQHNVPSRPNLYSTPGGLLFAVDESNNPLWESTVPLQTNFSAPSRFIASPNGTLFYVRSPDVIDVLPYSIPRIVLLSPVILRAYPDLLFVGKKEVHVFKLDPISGRVLCHDLENSYSCSSVFVNETYEQALTVTRTDYTLKVINQSLGITVFNHTHYEYLQVLGMIAGKGHQTNAVVPVRDLSGGNILASSIMDDPFLYYNESLTQNRDETRIATVQNFREFVSHYPQEVILNAQPNQIKEKSYENIVIVFLAVLLVISSMIIIKLLCLRQNCLKNAAQVVVPTEAESFSNTGHATDRENSAAPVSLKDEKVVEDNKHHGAELVPYKNINERLEPEIIDITPRKGSHQSTYRMIENKEYTLEKEPGAGIVKTTKQEIKEYFPEEAEPELLEEAKVISEKLGAEFDPQKVQLRNNKLTVGISTQRTADSCEVEAKSFYAIFTNRENARSVENNRFTKTFDCIELLGAGGFAEVYKARYILDGKFYAVKRIVMQHDFKESVKKRKAYREIYALQTFDHPYIVRYVTCWIEIPTSGTLLNTKAIPLVDTKNNSITESNAPVTQELGFEWDRQDDDSNTSKTLSKKLVCTSSNKDITLKEESPLQSVIQRTVPPPKVVLGSNTIDLTFYIQMVLYPKTLKDYLTERGSEIEPRRNLKYFTQIISALQEIHSKGLIHRDMKPANIFLDQDDNVKVGDFGLAVKMSEEGESPLSDELENRSVGAHTENVGTKQYLPPEQESGYYSEKVDIYATGLILMELCCTFSTGHERNLAFEGLKNKRVLPEAFDIRKYREEGELVMKMTETDPDERPSAVDVIDLLAYKRLIKRVKS